MTKVEDKNRVPRSVRKHIRRRKAAIRRELPPEQAKRAIERLMREAQR